MAKSKKNKKKTNKVVSIDMNTKYFVVSSTTDEKVEVVPQLLHAILGGTPTPTSKNEVSIIVPNEDVEFVKAYHPSDGSRLSKISIDGTRIIEIAPAAYLSIPPAEVLAITYNAKDKSFTKILAGAQTHRINCITPDDDEGHYEYYIEVDGERRMHNKDTFDSIPVEFKFESGEIEHYENLPTPLYHASRYIKVVTKEMYDKWVG